MGLMVITFVSFGHRRFEESRKIIRLRLARESCGAQCLQLKDFYCFAIMELKYERSSFWTTSLKYKSRYLNFAEI